MISAGALPHDSLLVLANRSKSWFSSLILALLALASLSCWAQGFPPVSPEDLKMTSESKAPGAPAIILYREIDREDTGNTWHEDNYVRIKILTEEGRKYGNVEIPFNQESTDVVRVQARTIKPDGSSLEFDGQLLEKTIMKVRGLQYVAKTFTLPNVQVASIIEYSYTIDLRKHYLFGSHWILSGPLFTRDAKFSLKYHQSPYMTLRWTSHELPPGAEPKDNFGGTVTMEAHDIPAFQLEDFMPPPDQMKSRVDFIYDFEYYESSADAYWGHVARNRAAFIDHFMGKRKAMEDAVAQIVSPSDPPETKLRKIYDRVQQIRNRSFEIRKTAEELKREKEKRDENVEDVWKRGYAAGTQINWLYLALVRAAGFEAYAVWVSDRRYYFFSPKSLDSRQLDEGVVLVKLNGKDLYFDPGAAFTPFGMLTWSATGVPGLCLDREGGTWVNTTLPQSSESRVEHVAKMHLTDTGNLEGKLTVTYTGLEAMHHRQDLRNSDNVTRKKFLEDRIRDQISSAIEVELTSQPDWNNSETPLIAEFSLKIQAWASNAGRRTLIPAGLFTAVEKQLFQHESRVQPIYVEYPSEKDDDVTIEIPEGWRVASVPTPQTQNAARVLAFKLRVDISGATLHITRNLSWDFLLVEPKYYPTLREFFQRVRTADDQQIVLEPATPATGN